MNPRTEQPCGFRWSGGGECLVGAEHSIHKGVRYGQNTPHEYEPFERRKRDRREEGTVTPRTETGKRLLIKYGLPVEADAEVRAIEDEAVNPRTEAGRALHKLSWGHSTDGVCFGCRDTIRIEAEATASAIERIEALPGLWQGTTGNPGSVRDLIDRAAVLAILRHGAACDHPGCGLPDRLHGAPDRSRATHSSHWFRGDSND